jgi:ABC-type multidrug transport system ATPase subunit
MNQKCHAAKRILLDPRVISMDEPTTGLDPHASRETRKLTHDLIAHGKTIRLTTRHVQGR